MTPTSSAPPSPVDLIWLGGGPAPPWPSGRRLDVPADPRAVAETVRRELPGSNAGAFLFWHSRLGIPDPERVARARSRPGDLWHAGLRLGMAGQPFAIDYVAPTWMLNRDPDSTIEATSWRVSLEACLVPADVLRRVGGIVPEFRTLAGAALEFGHRCVQAGVLTRHLPWLWEGAPSPTAELPVEDELRFLRCRFGRTWSRWAVFRMALTGRAAALSTWNTLRRIEKDAIPPPPPPFREPPAAAAARPVPRPAAVTVLIPTVDRYPYLEKLLGLLGTQSIRPAEIVVVDQTPVDRRRTDLAERFPDLPIRLFARDHAGQCSSRNAGIAESRGDYLLFLDDDDEVGPDLLAGHLAALERYRVDVSCGVADEDGAGPPPEDFRRTRASDVFPTNNAMIRKDVLSASGLFDLAYERGARADADLGMRLYLSGQLMVLNPEIRVLHRHAPSGGLRTHGARVITYASSRKRLRHRHLPEVTEIYLSERYFSPGQVREMLWIAALGTFSARGGALRRIAKAGIAGALLPHTLWEMRRRARLARAMRDRFPQIPAYAGERLAERAI